MMLNLATKAWEKLPTFKKEKSPGLAAVIGCLFGAIGLAIYFRSFIDFLFPVAVTIGLTVTTSASIGWFGGVILAGVYGFYRAQSSNERLATPHAAGGLNASEIGVPHS
jgi:hypothetical protein